MLKQCDALSVSSAATVGWRSTTTSVKTPYGAWRWADVTICSSAQTGAAIIYSLLGTCKLNDVESEAWLRDVLWKISDWSSNRVHELLPWNLETVK